MIVVNNKSFVGRNIQITNSKIIIDGVDVTPENQMKIDIKVDGNIEMLEVDCANSIVINGNAFNVRTSSGDVECKNVEGSITTSSGDVECGDVKGDINTSSGDVKCNNIGGSVRTVSGDIKNRK